MSSSEDSLIQCWKDNLSKIQGNKSFFSKKIESIENEINWIQENIDTIASKHIRDKSDQNFQFPFAFISYSHSDDDDQSITRFHQQLTTTLKSLTGNKINIFIDNKDIGWGDDFEKNIVNNLKNVIIYIPFLSPCFYTSEYCIRELNIILQRQEKLKCANLIKPVKYVDCNYLDLKNKPEIQKLKSKVDKYQYIDLIQHENISIQKIEDIANKLLEACAGM